jgi:hypothetical protein
LNALDFLTLVRFAVSPKWSLAIAALHRAVLPGGSAKGVRWLPHIETARIFAGNCFAKTVVPGRASLW